MSNNGLSPASTHPQQPPTQSQAPAQRPPNPNKSKVVRPSEREYASDLLCSDKYKSAVPEVPLDTKMLEYPFDKQRFLKYRPSTLEKTRKFSVQPLSLLPVAIELIDPEAYVGSLNARLHADDLALVQEEPKKDNKSKNRSKVHSIHVNWLIKTQYLSSDVKTYGDNEAGKREQSQRVKRTSALGREEQIQAVERTFQQIKDVSVFHHPKKKLRKAVSVLPVLPDMANRVHSHTLVVFDNEPSKVASELLKMDLEYAGQHVTIAMDAEKKKRGEEMRRKARQQMSNGLLHAMVDSSTGESYVGYFVPTKKECEDISKLGQFGEDVEYEHVRNYNWRVKKPMDLDYEPSCFFRHEKNAVLYCPIDLDVHLRLSRRKDDDFDSEFKKTVHIREFSRAEKASALKRRNSMLGMDDYNDGDSGSEKGRSRVALSTASPTGSPEPSPTGSPTARNNIHSDSD
eukprot:CFRG7539T1